ncbi:MAG TPA: hypothetical protein VFN16_14000 [Saccharospirillum sp.]|nr:hypothetical protein [Saccharospirillum sp.]
MTTAKLSYILVLFLVIFQGTGGALAWAESTADGQAQTVSLCANHHDVEHCGMADHSAQFRSHCGGMACTLPVVALAVASLVDPATQATERYTQPLSHSLHSGYHSALDRPPSL